MALLALEGTTLSSNNRGTVFSMRIERTNGVVADERHFTVGSPEELKQGLGKRGNKGLALVGVGNGTLFLVEHRG